MSLRDESQHVVVLNWKDQRHPEAGGAELYCHQVAAELQSRGHRVTMVVSRPEGQSAHDVVDGVKVRRLGGTFTVYLLALLWLWKHRRQIDAVIDSENGIPFFSPLALRKRTPVALLIHHVHQEQFGLYFSRPAAAVGRWLERTGAQRVYGTGPVVVVSPSSRTEVRRQLGLRGPVFVAPNGYRAPEQPPAVPRATTPTITVVGRLVVHKRLDLLLQAVAELRNELPDLQLHIVGSGPDRERLEGIAADLDLGGVATFHGFVSIERRDALLAGAWLTVQASRGEGWGLSVIEAAAFGIPTVALDVPGLRDSVRDGVTGWLTDEQHLTATIHEALGAVRDAKTATVWAEECRSWAARFPWRATADRLWAVLAEEAMRPQLTHDFRHARSDTATVVDLSSELARGLDATALRRTDQSTFCDRCVPATDSDDDAPSRPYRLLLIGADEVDAVAVLARAGINPNDPDASMRLARPSDLLEWSESAVIHHPGLNDVHPPEPTLPSPAPLRRRLRSVAADRGAEAEAGSARAAS